MSMNPFCELAVEQSLRLREGKVPSLPVESIVAVSIGPAKTVDTLRTALAMGADKAIHVEVNDDPEPLGVAKVLKAIAEREKSNLIILGKQSIDRDFGQTGQMLGGLLGWPQATCAAKMEISQDEKCTVTEEVDGGVQTVSAKLPMIVTTDLRYFPPFKYDGSCRLNEPRYASLPNIMKAKKKPLEKVTPGDLGVDLKHRLETLQVEEPPAREAGVKVDTVPAMIEKLKELGAL